MSSRKRTKKVLTVVDHDDVAATAAASSHLTANPMSMFTVPLLTELFEDAHPPTINALLLVQLDPLRLPHSAIRGALQECPETLRIPYVILPALLAHLDDVLNRDDDDDDVDLLSELVRDDPTVDDEDHTAWSAEDVAFVHTFCQRLVDVLRKHVLLADELDAADPRSRQDFVRFWVAVFRTLFRERAFHSVGISISTWYTSAVTALTTATPPVHVVDLAMRQGAIDAFTRAVDLFAVEASTPCTLPDFSFRFWLDFRTPTITASGALRSNGSRAAFEAGPWSAFLSWEDGQYVHSVLPAVNLAHIRQVFMQVNCEEQVRKRYVFVELQLEINDNEPFLELHRLHMFDVLQRRAPESSAITPFEWSRRALLTWVDYLVNCPQCVLTAANSVTFDAMWRSLLPLSDEETGRLLDFELPYPADVTDVLISPSSSSTSSSLFTERNLKMGTCFTTDAVLGKLHLSSSSTS